MTLFEWALKHRIPPAALQDLWQTCVFSSDEGGPESNTRSESDVQRGVRLEAARVGKMLFRNNRGAGKMESGNFVRYGLANDSKKFGDAVKSADLIGWESFVVTQEWVGHTIARFLSVECKPENWRPNGDKHELAQLKWGTIVNASGGRAVVVNRIVCP